MIGRTVIHYRIVSELGGGSVYKAEDTRSGRPVVLKFLPIELAKDEGALKLLSEEASALSQLPHNNICTIYAFGPTGDGHPFVAMEYCEGETLKERLARGPIETDDALGLVVQIADGLDHLHRADIVHRNIDPANVMVTPDGVAKLLCFGLATAVPGDSYMAPERPEARGADARSDVYSLGVVCYEMLSGTNPFETGTLLKSPDALGGPLAPLDPVIRRMLEKDPSRRYQRIESVVRDLAAAREGTLIQKFVRHQSRVTLTLAAVIALIAAVMLWFSCHDRRANGATNVDTTAATWSD